MTSLVTEAVLFNLLKKGGENKEIPGGRWWIKAALFLFPNIPFVFAPQAKGID